MGSGPGAARFVSPMFFDSLELPLFGIHLGLGSQEQCQSPPKLLRQTCQGSPPAMLTRHLLV